MSKPFKLKTNRVGKNDVELLVATGGHREGWVRGGGLEVQAGAVAVCGVAAVVEHGEQVVAVLDGQAARVAAEGLRVVAGQVAAGAELVAGGGHQRVR